MQVPPSIGYNTHGSPNQYAHNHQNNYSSPRMVISNRLSGSGGGNNSEMSGVAMGSIEAPQQSRPSFHYAAERGIPGFHEESTHMRSRLEMYWCVTAIASGILGLADMIVLLSSFWMVYVNSFLINSKWSQNSALSAFHPGVGYAICFGVGCVTAFINSTYALFLLIRNINLSHKDFLQETNFIFRSRISYGLWCLAILFSFMGIVLGLFVVYPDYDIDSLNKDPSKSKGTAGGITIAFILILSLMIPLLSWKA